MKIVSYNINACTQDKVDFLLSLEADVYVVPEIACQDKINLSTKSEYQMEWKSDYPTKGLGIIWRKGKGEVASFYNNKLTYAIPIIYEGVFILGFWPTKLKDEKKTYSKYKNKSVKITSKLFEIDPESHKITAKYTDKNEESELYIICTMKKENNQKVINNLEAEKDIKMTGNIKNIKTKIKDDKKKANVYLKNCSSKQ